MIGILLCPQLGQVAMLCTREERGPHHGKVPGARDPDPGGTPVGSMGLGAPGGRAPGGEAGEGGPGVRDDKTKPQGLFILHTAGCQLGRLRGAGGRPPPFFLLATYTHTHTRCPTWHAAHTQGARAPTARRDPLWSRACPAAGQGAGCPRGPAPDPPSWVSLLQLLQGQGGGVGDPTGHEECGRGHRRARMS